MEKIQRLNRIGHSFFFIQSFFLGSIFCFFWLLTLVWLVFFLAILFPCKCFYGWHFRILKLLSDLKFTLRIHLFLQTLLWNEITTSMKLGLLDHSINTPFRVVAWGISGKAGAIRENELEQKWGTCTCRRMISKVI